MLTVLDLVVLCIKYGLIKQTFKYNSQFFEQNYTLFGTLENFILQNLLTNLLLQVVESFLNCLVTLCQRHHLSQTSLLRMSLIWGKVTLLQLFELFSLCRPFVGHFELDTIQWVSDHTCNQHLRHLNFRNCLPAQFSAPLVQKRQALFPQGAMRPMHPSIRQKWSKHQVV